MKKQELIYAIKAWLQRFGNRDNDTFNYKITIWKLSMQYDYDLEGDKIEPFNWCTSGFKHVHNTSLEDRTEDELSKILDELLAIKKFY